MDEFSLIRLLTTCLRTKSGVIEGLGDDAAILDIPPGKQLVVSTDTLVAGVHFDSAATPADVGYKALAVNLSDLAAMGAQPAWYFMALTLPNMDADWVRSFAHGMAEVAQAGDITLAGGDLTSGPLSISVTVCGLVDPGKALLRSGAQPGDVVGISGPTGLAGRALYDLEHGREPAVACIKALNRPEPRLGFGRALANTAHSCIDVSDGLLADVGHIATASHVGVRIDLERLPVAPELADLDPEDRWNLQLGGGDDYELCFTAPQENWLELERQAGEYGVDAIAIGTVVEGDDCRCLRPDGTIYLPKSAGYNHGEKV